MEVNKERCCGCKYLGTLSGTLAKKNCCDYLLLTGHSRGCSVENCDKKEIGKRSQKRVGLKPKGVVGEK